ncbi:glycosyltransferase [Nakamurella silvestris]|nr:glycosyltransferase [Nakamurella silvestris]
MIDTAHRRPEVGAVGSCYLHMDGSLQEAGSVLWSDGTTAGVGDGGGPATISEWDFERRVDYCSGGALLVRRELWNQLGGLDDIFYPAYYEDIDFCLRLGQAGWQTWYQPRSVVKHIRSASSDAPFRRFITEANRDRFIERWQVQLAEREKQGRLEAAVFRASGKTSRVLVIDDRIPEGSIGSGFGRARDMLFELAADPDIQLTFHPVSWSAADRAEFASRGIRIVHDLRSHLAVPGVEFDVVVVSRPHNAAGFQDLLAGPLADVRFVYDAEALYHRRLLQQVEQASDDTRSALAEEAGTMQDLELAVVRAADAVVCISDGEAEVVGQVSTVPVTVVRALLNAPEATDQPFRSRADIGFVAGWAAGPGAPNSEALLWFARKVLPILAAELPGVRLLVTGGNPPPDVAWLESSDIRFVGLVPDLEEFYGSIRTAVSPMTFGAGVKLKTIEAVQYGVPVVATEEGAAGLDGPWREAITVTDDHEQFAAALTELMIDPDAWERRRQRGLELVRAGREAGDDVTVWPELIHRVRTQEPNPVRRNWNR